MNTLEPMNTLGQRIAHYRKRSALTQEELDSKNHRARRVGRGG